MSEQGCFTSGKLSGLGYVGPKNNGHRLAWEAVNGPIPQGMVVDHLCENRWCLNTDHMEIVTRGENTVRGMEMRSWRGQIRSFLDEGVWYRTHSQRSYLRGLQN